MTEWKLETLTPLCLALRSRRRRRREICTQALSSDVCQSVLYEVSLRARMRLVHYGWGAILRHGTCCIFIFWVEGDDTWLLPNPFMRFVQYLMDPDILVQSVYQRRFDPCLKRTRQEGGRRQGDWEPLKWLKVSPGSTSYKMHVMQ